MANEKKSVEKKTKPTVEKTVKTDKAVQSEAQETKLRTPVKLDDKAIAALPAAAIIQNNNN